MGKVRIKTLGIEEVEKEQKEKAKKRKEAKKLAKGAHGGERLVAMGPSEEELAKLEVPRVEEVSQVPQREPRGTRDTRTPRDTRTRQRGKHYKEALLQIDRKKSYPLPEALELLRKVGYSKFDGTVELHINTIEKGVNGQVALPHGTGKEIRVAIADDQLIEQVQGGKINFDILLAHPSMMAKLARVAKILGPRGLMPNPKSSTISEDPKGLALSFPKGQIQFKTEAQAPIIHLTVGRLSMGDKDLAGNITAILRAIGVSNIKNVTLKSTMSPGIKLDVSSLS